MTDITTEEFIDRDRAIKAMNEREWDYTEIREKALSEVFDRLYKGEACDVVEELSKDVNEFNEYLGLIGKVIANDEFLFNKIVDDYVFKFHGELMDKLDNDERARLDL